MMLGGWWDNEWSCKCGNPPEVCRCGGVDPVIADFTSAMEDFETRVAVIKMRKHPWCNRDSPCFTMKGQKFLSKLATQLAGVMTGKLK